MPWFLFNWPTFWLALALFWSYLCFKAGWHARGEEEIRDFMARLGWPRDDGPGGARV
jgi:hypothetical protein